MLTVEHIERERVVLERLCAAHPVEMVYVDQICRQAQLAAEAVEAVVLFQRFFDEMPKGQFGKICCDVGLMNDAFIASGRVRAKAKAVGS